MGAELGRYTHKVVPHQPRKTSDIHSGQGQEFWLEYNKKS